MRLFIAIDVPSTVAEHLRDIQTKLPSGVSLTKTYHLTLKFLGDVTPSVFENVKQKLQTIKFSPFNAILARVGFFPSSKTPRVIWVGVEPHDTICALQHLIDESLSKFFLKEKDFQPHITLARVKEPVIVPLLSVSSLTFPVTQFKLIESRILKGGPVYTELAAYPLSKPL